MGRISDGVRATALWPGSKRSKLSGDFLKFKLQKRYVKGVGNLKWFPLASRRLTPGLALMLSLFVSQAWGQTPTADLLFAPNIRAFAEAEQELSAGSAGEQVSCARTHLYGDDANFY